VLAEMLTGYVLFQNDSIPTMLARIIGILGPFPDDILRNGKETLNYFTVILFYPKIYNSTLLMANGRE
jgi:hypothetical protein